MSLSQLFAKPLDLIPTRKELWLSTRPTYRYDVVEKSRESKTLTPSKSESGSNVLSSSNTCSPKEEERDYRKSVLYSTRRRPTVQEFLRTNYHRHPKFCSQPQAAGLSEKRCQLQLQTQRIIPLKKDNENNFIDIKQVAKVSQQSSLNSRGKNLNGRITGEDSLSGHSNDTKQVSSMEIIGILGLKATSANPKDIVKTSSSNNDLSRPRFKTVVKNGSMVTIRLPPLKPKQNVHKDQDDQSPAVGNVETVSTEIISGALLPQRNDKKDLRKTAAPGKSSDHNICFEDKVINDCDQTMAHKVDKCSVERLKNVMDVPTSERDRDLQVTLMINDNKPVERKATGDETLANETGSLDFLEKEPNSFATGISKSIAISVATGKPEMKEEKHVPDSNENMLRGMKGSDLHFSVGNVKQMCSRSNQEEEAVVEKNVMSIEGGSQIPYPKHSQSKSLGCTSDISILEQQTQLTSSSDNLSTVVDESNITAQMWSNQSSKVSCELKCVVEQSNKSDSFVSDSGVATKPASGNVPCFSPIQQVSSNQSNLAEAKSNVRHEQRPKQTEQKNNENYPESNILPGECQNDDPMNSRDLNKQGLDGKSESGESFAELVFASSDSNFEEEENVGEKDEQCKDFPSHPTDKAPGPEIAEGSTLSDIDCEEGEILSSSDDELVQSESDLTAQGPLNENSDTRGTLNTTEKPMKTRSALQNAKKRKRKKKKKIAARKKGIQMTKQGTVRNGRNNLRVTPEKRKQPFTHQELDTNGSGAVANVIPHVKKNEDILGEGPVTGLEVERMEKEPSLLDSITGAVVDVTIAADEKLVKHKARGGSKEAQKLKKKIYKQKKRRLEGYRQPEKPRVKYEPLPPPVCKYYLIGICKMGTECSFRHEGEVVPIKKKELCKFYTTDCCSKGANCLFMHSDFPCMFFHTGRNCLRGDNCKYSHDSLTEDMKEVFEKYIQDNQQKEAENQTTANDDTRHHTSLEEDPGTHMHHGMVLRSRPHPTVNNTDSINTRYTPSSTPDNKTESINTRYTTSSTADTEEVPEDGLHGDREKSLGRNDNEAAELQRSSPYNLRLRERKRKTSEGERGTGSQTQKAAKKDESSSGKEHCTPRFIPGMYREVSN